MAQCENTGNNVGTRSHTSGKMTRNESTINNTWERHGVTGIKWPSVNVCMEKTVLPSPVITILIWRSIQKVHTLKTLDKRQIWQCYSTMQVTDTGSMVIIHVHDTHGLADNWWRVTVPGVVVQIESWLTLHMFRRSVPKLTPLHSSYRTEQWRFARYHPNDIFHKHDSMVWQQQRVRFTHMD